MNEIRTTKIDGQEFVTLTDYLRLKEENKVVWISLRYKRGTERRK